MKRTMKSLIIVGLLSFVATHTFAYESENCSFTPINLDAAIFGYKGSKVKIVATTAGECVDQANAMLGSEFKAGPQNARVLTA